MKNNLKKGFTLVELVIVIAVIAILSAVLIPTFSNLVQKANVSADTQLVKNLNTALSLSGKTEKHKTMYEALQAADECGYNVAKINATATNNEVLWDSQNDVFCYLNDGKIEYIPDFDKNQVGSNEYYKLWKISSSIDSNSPYSTYLYNFTGTTVNTTKGVDCGDCTGITAVNYTNTGSAQDVIIRTKGDDCVLTVNAPLDNVSFYGYAKDVNVTAIKNESLHIYGVAAGLVVTSGHVEIEDTGVVFTLKEIETAGSVTNNGYIGEKASTVTTQVAGKEVGGEYDIKTIAQFESFRDAVNGGYSFYGLTVNLLANITLKDGWSPIGEGARKSKGETSIANAWVNNGAGYAFAGTFNGNGYTISNLNTKGFAPSSKRLSIDDGTNIYSYGLFGVTASGACIKNLTLDKVAINTQDYTSANGDCVGAVVGFSCGSLTIENVNVYGTIIGTEAVAGIVGRAYLQETSVITSVTEADVVDGRAVLSAPVNVSIKKCNVNADIKTIGSYHCAGIIGYTAESKFDIGSIKAIFALNISIEECSVTGSIYSDARGASDAAGIVCLASNTLTLKNNKVENCSIGSKEFVGIFIASFGDTTNTTAKNNTTFTGTNTFTGISLKVNDVAVGGNAPQAGEIYTTPAN